MSAELQQPMLSVDAARRLTERIRLTAHSARESIEKLHVLVDEAKAGNAHLALGFASWTAYLAEVLGEEPLRLARDQRQELVGYLAGEGMSNRAIAPMLGVTEGTVRNDLSGAQSYAPEPKEPDEEWRCEICGGVDSAEHDDPEDCHCGCELDMDCQKVEPQEVARAVVAAAFAKRDEPAEPAKVTGLDGKTYTKPAPASKVPNRRALPDQARDAGQELRKATERLERLMADDRFSRNKQEVAAHLRHHLNHAIKVCQDLSASFTD